MAWRTHRLAALAITAGLMTSVLVLGDPPATVQWIMLLAGLVVTGIPHGAVDHLHGRAILSERYPTLWLPMFFGGYLLGALGVGAIWFAFPIVTLVGFLLIAAWHFGRDDAGQPGGWALALLLGSTPIATPILAHPEASGRLFAALTAVPEGILTARLSAMFWPLLLGWGGLCAMAARHLRRWQWADLAAVACSGLLLPPLMSFTVYFCCWHAPRHILAEAHTNPVFAGPRPVRSFLIAAVPMTLMTLALAGAFLGSLAVYSPGDTALTRTVFVGLAALTVPHMVVHGPLRTIAKDRARPQAQPI